MWNLCGSIGRWCKAAVIVAAVVVSAGHVRAADKVTLRDGTVLEGTIVRELEGNVWLKTMVGSMADEKFFAHDEVVKIERDAGAASASDAGKDALKGADSNLTSGPAAPKATGSKVPKAMVITMGDEVNGDMVGLYMTAHSIKEALPLMEQELGTDRTGVVVLRIHSGGGMLLEIQKLSDVIQNELKPRFRVVGWIDSAISAAAMTAHCIEELYFTSQANYGACTGFRTLSDAMEGFELEKVLHQMELISSRGGYDSLIMRSMQIQDPLSATINEDGTVKYYRDTISGNIIVNRQKEILTFNAVTAAKIKFSKGTADSLAELTKLMGYQELDWVGEKVQNVPWPVSKAEKIQMEYRKKVHTDEELSRNYQASYESSIEAASSAQGDDRAKLVGRARVWLEKIKAMVRNNPNQALMMFGGEKRYEAWLDEQEKIIRELMRR